MLPELGLGKFKQVYRKLKVDIAIVQDLPPLWQHEVHLCRRWANVLKLEYLGNYTWGY